MPIAHVSLPVSDLEASKAFYLTILKPLGYEMFGDFKSTIGMGPAAREPGLLDPQMPRGEEEEKEKSGKGGDVKVQKTHVAFQASSRSVVQAFHATALKAGATCNGPPGERTYTKGYYAAFVRDLDGNNIECVHWQPLWLTALQGAPFVLGAVVVGAASWWAGNQGWMMGIR